MNWELGAESLIVRRIDIANFGGDMKLCLCEACWMYLIYIQLGFHKLDRFSHVSMLLLFKSRLRDVCTGRRCPAKKSVFGSLPNFWCPVKEIRDDLDKSSWLGEIMRRINLRAKPKYEIFLRNKFINFYSSVLFWYLKMLDLDQFCW